jgi:hypothetical protein
VWGSQASFQCKFTGCSLPTRFIWGGSSFMNESVMRVWFAGDVEFPGRLCVSGLSPIPSECEI